MGMLRRVAKRSALKALSKRISAPWTPDPLRLGAYSERSIDLSHSITRCDDQTATSLAGHSFSGASSGVARLFRH